MSRLAPDIRSRSYQHEVWICDTRPLDIPRHKWCVCAVCRCGWIGPIRSGPTGHPVTIAQGDGRLHRREQGVKKP